jgi:beta-1,4-mannosyl-glycoprotein beta-1,4-N-acetylglucosaminyltransferase
MSAGDILMVSDADEIPSAEAVRRYHPSMGVTALSQPVSYYWLNAPTAPWRGTRIVPPVAFERSRNLNDFRGLVETVIEPGGWHFSYLGGAERVVQKLSSFAHIELATSEHMMKTITELNASSFREIDETFPRYIRENPERFAHLIRR